MSNDRLGSAYFNQTAYFLARGKSLDLIRQYELDVANQNQILIDLVSDYGAESALTNGTVFSDRKLDENVFKLDREYEHKGQTSYIYQTRRDTEEGKELLEKLDNVPNLDISLRVFAKRLTGKTHTEMNPDELDDTASYMPKRGSSQQAAFYYKAGGEYVIEVPRVLRAVFDKASAYPSEDSNYLTKCESYRVEWFTPADAEPVPYSRVIELQEKDRGDQTVQRAFKADQIFVLKPFKPV